MNVETKAIIREHAVRALRCDRITSLHSQSELTGTAARLARDLGLDAPGILADALRDGRTDGYPYLIADQLGASPQRPRQ